MGSPTDNIGGGILDQSEIDQLLSAAAVESRPPLIRADGTRVGDTEAVRVEAYDFRNPTFLTEVELRRLRILHEDFIRYLAARLAMFLRMECGLKMARLHTQTYAKFTEGLASPSHICLFKMDPLIGVGLLDVNPRLALTFVDRLLGGRGHSVKAERYLTEIEVSLLEDVLKIILEEWCSQWKEDKELHHAIIGHESNGRFLQTSARDSVVLALAIEVSFGDCSEQIQIGLPYYTIEPLVKSLQQRRQKDTAPVAAAAKAEWHDVYEHVQLPVRAEWNLPDMPLREIASMRVGDLLEIPLGNIEQTRVLLNGIPKFLATVGLEGQQVAVKLNRKLTEADQVRS
jgi:flagellar motor switch protein FliM